MSKHDVQLIVTFEQRAWIFEDQCENEEQLKEYTKEFLAANLPAHYELVQVIESKAVLDTRVAAGQALSKARKPHMLSGRIALVYHGMDAAKGLLPFFMVLEE